MRSKQRPVDQGFDLAGRYHDEIGQVRLLSTAEEYDLADKIEASYYQIFDVLCNTRISDRRPHYYGLKLLREYLESGIRKQDIEKYDGSLRRRRILPHQEEDAEEREPPLRNKHPTKRQEAYFNYCYREIYLRKPIRQAGISLSSILTKSHHHEAKSLLLHAEKQLEKDREDFILANRRLVASIAKKYVNYGLSYLDLNQEGSTGLMSAIDKYDHKKGHKFSTYATWWIRQAMTRATADQGKTIRLPVHIHELLTKIYRVQNQLWQELHREPTTQEIADTLDLKIDKIVRYIDLKDPLPTSLPVGENEESELGDFIPDTDPSPETNVNQLEEQRILDNHLRKLTPREEFVIRGRFGLGSLSMPQSYGKDKTLDEVGNDFDLTRERIRQIEAKAIRKLRQKLKSKGLNDD